MKLNLRKARKLENKIQNHLNGSTVSTETSVRVKGGIKAATDAITAKKIEVVTEIQNRRELIHTRFSIRNKIAAANESVGVNKLMLRREEILSQLKDFKNIGGSAYYDSAELEDLLNAKATRLDKGEGYGFSKEVCVDVGVVSDKQLDSLKSNVYELRKELEDIEDELGQKNLGSKISLSEEEVLLLSSNKLL